jgi:hypothetical protein
MASMSVTGSDPDICAYGGVVGRTIWSRTTTMLTAKVVIEIVKAATMLNGRLAVLSFVSRFSSLIGDEGCSSWTEMRSSCSSATFRFFVSRDRLRLNDQPTIPNKSSIRS